MYLEVVFTIIVVSVTLIWFFFFRNQLRDIQANDCILITGASSGIGYASALQCNADGFYVFAGVRNLKDGEQLKQQSKYPDRLEIIQLDVTQSQHIQKCKQRISSKCGSRGLLGLFNNAGISFPNPSQTIPKLMEKDFSLDFEHTTMEQYRMVFDVNFLAIVETTKCFYSLLKQHPSAIIVCNSSCAGFFAPPYLNSYASSKYAMEGFCDSLRRENYYSFPKVTILEPAIVTTTPYIHGEGTLEKIADTPEKKFYQYIFRSGKQGESAEEVGRLISKTFQSQNPPPRILCGRGALMTYILHFFTPQFLSDWIYNFVIQNC